MNNERASTLVCFALKEEAAFFRKLAAGKSAVFILLTGMGRANAEKSLRDFLSASASAQPEQVLTCGFAGGLDPDFKIGDVVFEIPEPASGATAGALRAQLLAAGAKPARFYCADRMAITATDKTKLREETGAAAVEMESAAIQRLCRERGIACATVRVISDAAGDDLPLDFNALCGPDQNLDYGRLLLVLARSPGKIAGLLKLQQQSRLAARKLAEVLAKIV